MKSTEFLIERVKNLFTPEQKMKVADQVWAVLQKAYEPMGGFHSAPNVEELVKDSGLWKVITRGDEITSVFIYKDSHGRKTIAGASNGTRQGLKDYIKTNDEDIVFQRAWAEVSGKPELFMAKCGAKPLPAKFAGILTGKKIIEVNPDGYHYTRMINGHEHEKVIYGCVNLTKELEAKIIAAGIELHELPDNFNRG